MIRMSNRRKIKSKSILASPFISRTTTSFNEPRTGFHNSEHEPCRLVCFRSTKPRGPGPGRMKSLKSRLKLPMEQVKLDCLRLQNTETFLLQENCYKLMLMSIVPISWDWLPCNLLFKMNISKLSNWFWTNPNRK